MPAHIQPMLYRVKGADKAGPLVFHQLQADEAHKTAANHRDAVAGPDAKAAAGVDAAGNGFP